MGLVRASPASETPNGSKMTTIKWGKQKGNYTNTTNFGTDTREPSASSSNSPFVFRTHPSLLSNKKENKKGRLPSQTSNFPKKGDGNINRENKKSPALQRNGPTPSLKVFYLWRHYEPSKSRQTASFYDVPKKKKETNERRKKNKTRHATNTRQL